MVGVGYTMNYIDALEGGAEYPWNYFEKYPYNNIPFWTSIPKILEHLYPYIPKIPFKIYPFK